MGARFNSLPSCAAEVGVYRLADEPALHCSILELPHSRERMAKHRCPRLSQRPACHTREKEWLNDGKAEVLETLTVSCSKVLMVPPEGQVAGMTVGAAVGAAVGAEGADVGVPAGAAVGAAVGDEGAAVGVPAGAAVGAAVGVPAGAAVGPAVPSGVGAKVGVRVGAVGDVGVTGPVDRHTLSMANCRWHTSRTRHYATASLLPLTWPQQLGKHTPLTSVSDVVGALSTGCDDWQTSKHSELTCLVKCQSGKQRAATRT